jgi:SAM-dependent methyltransferase
MATATTFRATFACLWCGTAHTTRTSDDLEGWAQLCPTCLGRAGENSFLRFRLHAAIADRATAEREDDAPDTMPEPPAAPSAAPVASVTPADPDEMVAYYEARAPEYDDWYLRRGRYARGPIDDMAWQAELDAATTWLDGLPLAGRIVELAAGTGWWSPLLATKGELWCYDAATAPLDRARDRLLAHRLRAHLHVRNAWADPEQVADALFTGFWLSHVPRTRLPAFLGLAARWLRPGGTYAFIDSRFDPKSSAVDHELSRDGGTALRRLNDGRTFTIPKIYYEPGELEAALLAAGFATASVTTTPRFFLLGQAIR